MSNENKEKIDFNKRELTVETALYVMAIGAVLADGVVEDDELGVVCDIADMFGHESHFDDAISYHEHFKDIVFKPLPLLMFGPSEVVDLIGASKINGNKKRMESLIQQDAEKKIYFVNTEKREEESEGSEGTATYVRNQQVMPLKT